MSIASDGQYEGLLKEIWEKGDRQLDRTGTGTRSLFGKQLRYNLQNGFPLITTKRVFTKGVLAELLWLLDGDTNIAKLQSQGVHIWDAWADENGDLGPIYGKQWRRWQAPDGSEIDQISQVLHEIKTNPTSRRLIVNAWNVGEIDDMALPPCHAFFQFRVANGKLSCSLTQRSADMFLGVPFNIASYAFLTHMMAQQANLKVGELVWTGGDCHIYNNHEQQVKLQWNRKPFQFPTLQLTRRPSLFDYKEEDFTILNYQHHPAINGKVAV